MLTSNLDFIPGAEIRQHIGLVEGSTVRVTSIGKDMLASVQHMFGGELSSYTELMREARAEAERRMLASAELLGANAVLNIRFTTTNIQNGTCEILALGTGVVVAAENVSDS